MAVSWDVPSKCNYVNLIWNETKQNMWGNRTALNTWLLLSVTTEPAPCLNKQCKFFTKSQQNLVHFQMSGREAFLLVTTEVVATLFRFYWTTSQNELIKPILLHPTMPHCRLLWEIWACIVFPYNYWLHSLTVSSFFHVLKESRPGNALVWLLLTNLHGTNNSLKSAWC